jgi:diaminohydroxyphosphoribosylaminopyrimidine deaminase/5-amino-6-(5-phosphoribosylamino)uracil reductase
MSEAIDLAAGALPHPNPRVGAVVIDSAGEVAGRGRHDGGPGNPHAEVLALAAAGERAAGGTIVVTLEPCDHEGRTPPCSAAIRAAGIARVVVGAGDPDERVSGRGIAALRSAGIEVVEGVCAAEVEAMDPGYFHHRRTGRPLVTLKAALTLDGQAAAADGTSQWITSPEAREDAHRLRARVDAVLVGAGTVLADDPRLTARAGGSEAGAQPRPVVVAGSRPLPREAAVFGRDPIVFVPAAVPLPGRVVEMPGPGGVDLGGVIDHLGSEGIVDLMVEGGPRIAGSLLSGGLVDRLVLYLGARLAAGTGRPGFAGVFGTLADAVPVAIRSVAQVGPDLRIDCSIGGA